MKSEKEILAQLNELKSDERLTYKSADIFGNAPLALIQLGLENRVNTLEWVLGLPMSKFPLPKKQNKKEAVS